MKRTNTKNHHKFSAVFSAYFPFGSQILSPFFFFKSCAFVSKNCLSQRNTADTNDGNKNNSNIQNK